MAACALGEGRNLAGLLHSGGQIGDAIRELEASEPYFAVEPDGHRIMAFLARCCRDADEHEKADSAWERTRLHAASVADEDFVLAESSVKAHYLEFTQRRL